jgi:hypothetical protein
MKTHDVASVLIGNVTHPRLVMAAAAVAGVWIAIDLIQFGFWIADRLASTELPFPT